MKRSVVAFFLVFSGSISLFAQSGYKDYSWGISSEQVKQKSPDVRETANGFSGPLFSFYYIYYDELDSFPNPIKQEIGKMTEFYSQKNNLNFHFVDNKLVAVAVTFYSENILPELKKQNGNKKEVSIRYSGNKYQTITWNKDPNRYIVYDSAGYGIETVTYIDGKWVKPLFNKAFASLTASSAQSKAKLD